MREISLFDSHVHLQDELFDEVLGDELEWARRCGTGYWACNGTSEKDWQKVINLSRIERSILPFVGLHPWYTPDRTDNWFSTLESIVASQRVGVGEIGMDGSLGDRVSVDVRDIGPSLNEEIFRLQYLLAIKYNRPVTVHCVRAWDELLRVLKSEPVSEEGIILHSFNASPELTKSLLDFNVYFSFSCDVLNPKRRKARDAIKVIPKDRILIETDAPNSPPIMSLGARVKEDCLGNMRSLPSNLCMVHSEVAKLVCIEEEAMKEILYNNSCRVFRTLLW